jgi:ankyrin repeat protein
MVGSLKPPAPPFTQDEYIDMFIAVIDGEYRAVKLNLDAGMDVNLSDKEGISLLMVTMQNKDIRMMLLLFKYGVDSTRANIYGITAKDIAAQYKYYDVVEMLNRYERGEYGKP